MHRGTCVTHMPWCIPVSLTSVFLWSRCWENVPGIPDACTTHNILVRGPWLHLIVCWDILSLIHPQSPLQCDISCVAGIIKSHATTKISWFEVDVWTAILWLTPFQDYVYSGKCLFQSDPNTPLCKNMCLFVHHNGGASWKIWFANSWI